MEFFNRFLTMNCSDCENEFIHINENPKNLLVIKPEKRFYIKMTTFYSILTCLFPNSICIES